MALKVSVSDLDQLIWYHRIESMQPEELVSRFKRERPMTPEMFAGTAWHTVLENHAGGSLAGVYEQDGFTFTVEADAQIRLPHIQELGSYKIYRVNGFNVVVGARCDGLSGNVLSEFKLTGNPDPMNMIESYQWRAYLDIWNARAVDYTLFKRSGKGFNLKIVDVYPLRLYRPAGDLEKQIEAAIRDYLDFAERWMPEIFENYKD